MPKGQKISTNDAINSVSYFGFRKPHTTDEEMKDAFCTLSEYRDGGVFAGHYAGFSEWERHPVGDEIVMVLDGETTLILLEKNVERKSLLRNIY